MSLLISDRTQLETFFRVMFYRADTGTLSIRGFSKEGKVAFIEGYLIQDDSLFIALEQLSNKAANLDQVVFCSPICTFKTLKSAAEHNVANGLCLSVDLDNIDPRIGRKCLEQILGPATMVIESGGKWEDPVTGEQIPRLHLHWRLSTPTKTETDHTRLKEARKRAAMLANGDASGAPISHPFRWPGSWHTKMSPTMCQIIEVREDTEVSLDIAEQVLQAAMLETPKTSKLSTLETQSTEGVKGDSRISQTYAQASLNDELRKLAAATQARTERTAKQKATNAAQAMSDKQLIDFADAMLWDSTQDPEILRNEVEFLAETEPKFFNELVDGRDIEYRALVQQALNKGAITFNPAEYSFAYGGNNHPIITLSPNGEQNEVQKMASWLQTGGQDVYKKIKSLVGSK